SLVYFFFSSRRRHTRFSRDWSSDVCSSDLVDEQLLERVRAGITEHRDRLGALPLDLADHGIERLRVARVVVCFVEPDGDPRRARAVLPRGAPPRVELGPRREDAAAGPALRIRIVVAELEARLRVRQREPIDARPGPRGLPEPDRA